MAVGCLTTAETPQNTLPSSPLLTWTTQNRSKVTVITVITMNKPHQFLFLYVNGHVADGNVVDAHLISSDADAVDVDVADDDDGGGDDDDGCCYCIPVIVLVQDGRFCQKNVSSMQWKRLRNLEESQTIRPTTKLQSGWITLYIYIFSSSLMPLNGNDLFRLVSIYKTPSVCFSFDSRLRDILPESLDFTITKSVCFNNRTSNDSFKWFIFTPLVVIHPLFYY